MKLKKFKERDNKRIGIIVFTLACILLVSSVILYRTFAIFEVKTTQNVIKGTIQDPGNIYFAFYVDDKIQKEMPERGSGYILDEEASYCGITGSNDESIKISLTEDWELRIRGVTSSRTKCNLKFVKGTYILGKPIKAVTSDNGLYEVTHTDVNGTINDNGFQQTEWRYAGASPNNYVNFNGETWRIIGLVNVMTDENTVEQRVKIIRNEKIETLDFNKSGSNNWATSTLQKTLNESPYFDRTTGTCYKNNNENTCDFTGTGLLETSRNAIDKVFWNVTKNNSDTITADTMYNSERKNNETWEGYIGLIYPSDYGYSVGNNARKECLTKNLSDYDSCFSSSYFNNIGAGLTMIAREDGINDVFFISSIGKVQKGGTIYTPKNVYPVVYLKTNVKILNDIQDGSESQPFNLTLDTTE